MANKQSSKRFLSTPSARRATVEAVEDFLELIISIHALREEGDPDIGGGIQDFTISIHALREEGDNQQKFNRRSVYISIHALREEGDHKRRQSVQ